MTQFFESCGQSIEASATDLPMNIRVDFLSDGLVGSPKDSQESSPAPQLEGINSSALTSIHDYWKNHSFDYTDLCRQNNASAF